MKIRGHGCFAERSVAEIDRIRKVKLIGDFGSFTFSEANQACNVRE